MKQESLVPPENSSILAEVVNELLSNKEKAEKLATNGNTFVKNNMTWDVILPKYVSNSMKICLKS